MTRADRHPYGTHGQAFAQRPKRPSRLQIGLGLVALVILSGLAFRQIQRMTTTPVWTVTSQLKPGEMLSPSHAAIRRLASKQVSDAMLGAEHEIYGKRVYRAKSAGEPLLQVDFQPPKARPPKSYLSDSVPEGRVLMMVKVSASTIPLQQLRHGDRLDLVANLGKHGPAAGPQVIARQAFVIGTAKSGGNKKAAAANSRLGVDTSAPERKKKGGGSGSFLILGLDPTDALTVAEAQTMDSSFAIILHGAHELRAGRLFDLRPQEALAAELITGAKRETVTFLPEDVTG